MNRRLLGAPGISLVLHAGLLLALMHSARFSTVAASITPAASPTKFVMTVTPAGTGGPGGSGNSALSARSRTRPAESRPLDVSGRHDLTSVEPVAMIAIPAITTQTADIVVGAPARVDGTGIGTGGLGAGDGRGPGIGPGAGPGIGDVYESGVGGVSGPTLLHEVRPNYTVDAMRARVQGVVVLRVVVRADGTVDPAGIRITQSLDPGLDQEAANAVRQWRFRPSMRLGQPVASRVLVELAFTVR